MLPLVTDGIVLSLLSSDPKWAGVAETIPATVGGTIASWIGEGFRATQDNATHGPVLQANGILPIRVQKVWNTNTTATNIVALW